MRRRETTDLHPEYTMQNFRQRLDIRNISSYSSLLPIAYVYFYCNLVLGMRDGKGRRGGGGVKGVTSAVLQNFLGRTYFSLESFFLGGWWGFGGLRKN